MQVGVGVTLVVAEGDEAQVVAERAQYLQRDGVGRAVQSGHHRRAHQAVHQGAHGARGDAVVVVDHVELARQAVRLETVHDLQVAAALDLLERRPGEDEREARLCLRVAAGEQGHVVAAAHEALGEQAHDELDAAVATRRQRKPGRCDHADAHGTPLRVEGLR